MARTYQRVLSAIIPQGKNRDSCDPRSQTVSGEDSTWMVDCLGIPRIVGSLLLVFSFFIEALHNHVASVATVTTPR